MAKPIKTFEKKGTTNITPAKPKIANNVAIKKKKAAITVTKFKCSALNFIIIFSKTLKNH